MVAGSSDFWFCVAYAFIIRQKLCFLNPIILRFLCFYCTFFVVSREYLSKFVFSPRVMRLWGNIIKKSENPGNGEIFLCNIYELLAIRGILCYTNNV